MVKEQTINAILHFLENVAPIGDTKRFFSCFDNALVLDKSLQNYDEDFCFLDVHPVRDLAFKIDYSQVFWNDKDQNYSFNRVKTINPKTVRGKYKVYTPHMLQWDGGILETNNKTYYHSTLVSWINNQWLPNSALHSNKQFTDVEIGRFQALLGCQFAQRYDWLVSIGRVGQMKLSFPTCPVSAKELFKMRDIPDGKKRRESLRTWISEHRRNRPMTDDDSIFVRTHLRGTTKFTWDGYECIIKPSEFDLTLNGSRP